MLKPLPTATTGQSAHRIPFAGEANLPDRPSAFCRAGSRRPAGGVFGTTTSLDHPALLCVSNSVYRRRPAQLRGGASVGVVERCVTRLAKYR